MMSATNEGMGSVQEPVPGLFGWPEYLVFGGMMFISLLIGIYYGVTGNKQNTTSEFLMGGRSLGVFPVAASLIASFISAVTLLGTPAEVYLKGTLYWMIGPAFIFVVLSTSYIYLPVFFDLQLTSVYEYLELRFSRSVRQLGSAIFMFQMTTYMAIVVYAPSLALSQVTGLNMYGCVIAIFFICTFYTTVGGMRGVVWTDTFQVFIMFAAMIMVIVKGAHDVGGHVEVWNIASRGKRIEFLNFDLDPRTRHTVWGLLIGGYFSWVNLYGCNQTQVQRYLSVATKQMARRALLINLLGLLAIISLCCYAGLVIYAKYSSCDPIANNQVTTPDQLLPLLVMDSLSDYPGLPGLFVAGIFSGALSTISSGLNSLAAIALEDFIKGSCFPNLSDKVATTLSRCLAVFFGVISFGLVFVAQKLGGVLQATLSVMGITGGPVLGLFTLGMMFPWANWKGALGGSLISLAFTLWLGIGANLAIMSKQIIVPNLPMSVEGCIGNLTLSSVPMENVEASESSGLIEFYRISYIWYSAISCCLTVILGVIISFLTKPQDPRTLNAKLISPAIDRLVRWILPANLRHAIAWEFDTDMEKPIYNEYDFYNNTILPEQHQGNSRNMRETGIGFENPAYAKEESERKVDKNLNYAETGV